ncbi:hypothetical protein QQS21_011861 [Conoideocrella luteorostrata]|uniref:N-acetyltransferase domain-containing protein n=1 Tax=Conoideocrella luteorostrata TaxID=1105319 RepID=A0AAJ0FVF3_9HYPO|nr:hypothetical protein QQS21_011861 [Conoideocrella luteorostrata]
MPQPTLATSRLTLTPLTAATAHLNLIIRLDTNPRVMKYIEKHVLTTQKATDDHSVRLKASLITDGLGYWVGYYENQPIGWWSLAPCTKDNGEVDPSKAELGYRLLPQYWRQGLAKEGAGRLVRYGFEEMGLKEVFGQTMNVNEGSRKTMEACGMGFVRRFWEQFEDAIEGTEEGEVEYAIEKGEWEVLGEEKKGLV